MTQAELKAKIRRRELTIGSWITLGHTAIAEILAQAGFEWLSIDLEHTAITLSETLCLIQVIEPLGCSPLVRVTDQNPSLIKRVLDMGAHGVIVPCVNSRAEAQAVVRAVRYPPVGTRGMGLHRAHAYGVNFEGYRDQREPQSIVIVQIEHIHAVEHLEDILSVEGIDGFMVGPYDLSGSLGVPGAFDHPSMTQALRRVREVATRLRVASGVHVVAPDPEQLSQAIRDGFTFIPFSFDGLLLSTMARTCLKTVKELVPT